LKHLRTNKGSIKDLLFEAYVETVRELEKQKQQIPSERNSKIPGDVKEALKKAVNLLFGKSYLDFVDRIQLVVPKPSEFQVFLKNGQSFYLKWLPKPHKQSSTDPGSFQAEIEGKKYFLNSISQYEQALDKLGEILKNGPISAPSLGQEPGGAPETPTGGEFGTGDTGGGPTPTEFGAPPPEDKGPELPDDFTGPEDETPNAL